MKYSLRALPTLLLLAAAFAIAKAPPTISMPATTRAAQLRQLHVDLDQLQARQRALDAETTAPFLPRGGGLQAGSPQLP